MPTDEDLHLFPGFALTVVSLNQKTYPLQLLKLKHLTNLPPPSAERSALLLSAVKLMFTHFLHSRALRIIF